MTIIKAAAVQISPVLYSREGTVDRVVRGFMLRRCVVCRTARSARAIAPSSAACSE